MKRFTPPPPIKKEMNSGRKNRSANLNNTIVTNLNATGSVPRMFRCASSLELQHSIGDDRKLECDMVYNDYLQALMKKDIVSRTIIKHDQDMGDQLAVQKDSMHKSRIRIKELRQEIHTLDILCQAEELTSALQQNINTYTHLNEEFSINDILEDLFKLFELLCNRIYVKNLNAITDQDSIDKFTLQLETCVGVLKKIEYSVRTTEESINRLGELMQKYKLFLNSVIQKQTAIREQHKNETFILLKTMSDMYAQKEN